MRHDVSHEQWAEEMNEITAGFVRQLAEQRHEAEIRERLAVYARHAFPMLCTACRRLCRLVADMAAWPACPFCRQPFAAVRADW